MSFDGNCGKSGQTNLIFCMMLPVGAALCIMSQYGVYPPLAAIIVTRLRGMLATRRCRRSMSISAHSSSSAWWSSPKILGQVVHTGDCTAQFIPDMLYGVAVWRSYRLVYLGAVALLKEIKDYSTTVRCGVIAIAIPEMRPGKWH